MRRVLVHRNLNKGGFSILDPHTRLVTGYTNNGLMGDVTFKVSQKGRERAIRKEQRNVHAFAEGDLLDGATLTDTPSKVDWVEVTYNPFKYTTFVRKDTEQPVTHSPAVLIYQDRMYIPR